MKAGLSRGNFKFISSACNVVGLAGKAIYLLLQGEVVSRMYGLQTGEWIVYVYTEEGKFHGLTPL
jgi:hypothetical protein